MTTEKPPLRLFSSLLHLAALGTLGWAALITLISVAATGIGLVFVFGLGLVLLVGVVYGMFGLGWFETARVGGLYRLDVPLPQLRRPASPGFGAWLRSLGAQLGDSPMWRSLANFSLAALLGLLVVPLLRLLASGVALLLAPLGGPDTRYVLGMEVPAATGPIWGVAALVIACAAVRSASRSSPPAPATIS